MDQFCAKRNDTYRRCICSSRLDEIQSKERALGQTAQQLQDFKDLNLDSISKTGAEVKAMLSATTGESASASAKDNSASAQQLEGISAVLAKTKSNSLSTQGKLDIAGDINVIWSTTDLAAGADIMNLTGEKLYNAVHSQCAEFVAGSCESKSISSMVVSAYGMYIENDCTSLSNALAKKTTEAGGEIRQTEREMNLARLDNYNAHNSTGINDCIAQVRKDITSSGACGENYVHCLDITGKYLNRDTGEPIYSPDFYQLELQVSLTGDVLSNQANRMLVAELNKKKTFAERGLDTCRDLSGEVWDEFMRQAVAEIYQGQQSRIRQVKNECVEVVNNCYDTQSKSLKDFSNIKEQLVLGARMELSEQMCKEKLDACSNLYGGSSAGLSELISTMSKTVDQTIAKDCKIALEEYALDICATPSSDILHAYPYSCRVYAPGNQIYATVPACNQIFTTNPDGSSQELYDCTPAESTSGYNCPAYKQYNSCAQHYVMVKSDCKRDDVEANNIMPGNHCSPCPDGYRCEGGTAPAVLTQVPTESPDCGDDYVGSLYQKLVRYGLQTCMRPSIPLNEPISTYVLGDVNTVMDAIKVKMGTELAAECERLGGTWISDPWIDTNDDKCHDVNKNYCGCDSNTRTNTADCNCPSSCQTAMWYKKFYDGTSANKKWGYCAPPL
jgi:hypothetical protein